MRARFVTAETRRLAKEKIEALHAKAVVARQDGAVNLESLAKQAGLKFSSTGLFSAGSYIEGVGASDAFSAAASKLDEGALSDVIELPSGFYIVTLKDKPFLDETKFEADKEKFALKVLNQKKEEFLSHFSEELMKKALGAPALPAQQPIPLAQEQRTE